MFNRDIIEHVCFQQRVPLDIGFQNRDRYVILFLIFNFLIFNVKHCKERKKEKFFWLKILG
jgi:hypothetical protein